MGGTCCTNKYLSGDIAEIFIKKFVVEKDETLENLDWKYKIDHSYYIPKKEPKLNNKTNLGDDMLKYLDSFNSECAFNQFSLIKENKDFPLSAIGIIKSIFNFEKQNNSKDFVIEDLIQSKNNSFTKEKIGTGVLISPYIVLTVIQNVFEIIENEKNIKDFKILRYSQCEFYAQFNGLKGFQYEIEEIILPLNFQKNKINKKSELNGFCFLILKEPIGLETGFVGLPRFLKKEKKYNFAKQQSIRENKRENQSVEIHGHTFYRIDKQIFLFESKIFSKKVINPIFNKAVLSIHGINFDMLPGAPIFYPKNDKKILMGMFSHTQKDKIEKNIHLNKPNNKNRSLNAFTENENYHKDYENEDSTGGIINTDENQEINFAFLLEEYLDDLIFSLNRYYEIKKLNKRIEIELHDKSIIPNDLDRFLEYGLKSFPNSTKLSIKNISFSENTNSILEKMFVDFKYLKELNLENNQLSCELDIDFTNLKSISELNLSYNNLSKNTVMSLTQNLTHVRKLKLIKCNITDFYLNLINNNLFFIELLAINYNEISDAPVINLMDSMKNLKQLYLKGNSLTDKCLEKLDINLPFIELISLSENKITNAGVKRIVEYRKKGMIYLNKLYLSSNLIDNEGAMLIKEIYEFFDELDISNNNINKTLMNEVNKLDFS